MYVQLLPIFVCISIKTGWAKIVTRFSTNRNRNTTTRRPQNTRQLKEEEKQQTADLELTTHEKAQTHIPDLALYYSSHPQMTDPG